MRQGYIIFFMLSIISCSGQPEIVMLDNGAHYLNVSSPQDLNAINPEFCSDIALSAYRKAGTAICGLDVSNNGAHCPDDINCTHVQYHFDNNKLTAVNHTIKESGWLQLSELSSELYGNPENSEVKKRSKVTSAGFFMSTQTWKLKGDDYSLTVMTNHDQDGHVEREAFISSISVGR